MRTILRNCKKRQRDVANGICMLDEEIYLSKFAETVVWLSN